MLFQSLVYRAALEVCCTNETEIVTPPIAQHTTSGSTTHKNHFAFVGSNESPIALLAASSSLFYNSSLGPNVISNTLQKSDRLLDFFLVLDSSSTLQFLPRLILQKTPMSGSSKPGTELFSTLFWSSHYFRRSLREIVVYSPSCKFLNSILFRPKEQPSTSVLLLPPPALEKIILLDCSGYEICLSSPGDVPSIYFPNLSEIHLRTSTKDKIVWNESLQTHRLKYFDGTFAFNTSQFIYDYLGCFRTTPIMDEESAGALTANSSPQIRLFLDGGIRDMFFADDDETDFDNKLKSKIFKGRNIYFHHLNIDMLYTHNHFRRQQLDWLMTEAGLAIMRNLSILVLNARCHPSHLQQEFEIDDERSIMFDDPSSRCSFLSFAESFTSLLRFGAYDNPASPLKILDFSNFSEVHDSMLMLSPDEDADAKILKRAETQALIECRDNEVPTEKYFFFPNLKALDVSGNKNIDGSFLVNWSGLKNAPSVPAPLSNLEILDMSQTNLDPAAVDDVFTKLPKLRVLKLVRLKSAEDMQNFDIDNIFHSLSRGFWAKSLVEMDLRLTPIGDKGLKWLVDACKNGNDGESFSTSSLRILRIENFDRSETKRNNDQSSERSFQQKIVSLLGLATICELKNSLEILEIGIDFEMIFENAGDPFTKAKIYFTERLANLKTLIIL